MPESQPCSGEPLRIVYTSPFFSPARQFGGPVALLENICPYMANRGHVVRVVTTDLGIGTGIQRNSWVENDGYQVWYAKTSWLNRLAPYLPPDISRPLGTALAEADVLHLSLGLTLMNAAVRREAQRYNTPYIYTPQGVLCPVRLRDRWLSKAVFLRLFERRVIRDAAALQPLTMKEKNDLLLQGGHEQQMHVIPNCVDMGLPTTWPQRKHAREQFGISPNAQVVLYLGQLLKIKGLEVLIDAVAKVRQKVPEVVLVIAGPDNDYGAVLRNRIAANKIKDGVRFCGFVEGERKRQVIRAADVLALTSYSEGLPIAVLEACAMEVPVLITPACNLPEVAEYGAGRVELPEVDRLTEALRQMLSDDQGRRQMGCNARRMVAERFSLERVGSELERVYKTLKGQR